jgi:uncharacterized protein (UPF0548 family)
MEALTRRIIGTQVPGPDELRMLFDGLSTAGFSYPEVGATLGEIPSGYNVDRYSGILGEGDAVFESAKRAIRGWVPFHMPWIQVLPQAEPSQGVLVAVVARIAGLWWTNVSRVIYTIDEPDLFGFAYGTLQFHAETGEELFLVERSRESAQVEYRILAFSRPRHVLARLGYPLSRAAQRRFGAASVEAMRNATSSPAP